jgi:hypothetical protein
MNGAKQASDSALVTGSAEMKWTNGLSLAGTFEGEFSNVTTSYAGKASSDTHGDVRCLLLGQYRKNHAHFVLPIKRTEY